jgi:hypothetical protein
LAAAEAAWAAAAKADAEYWDEYEKRYSGEEN